MVELTIIEHPLAAGYLSKIRNKNTEISDFKKYVDILSYLLASYSYSELEVNRKIIETPLMRTEAQLLSGEVVLMPILRAGLGLMKGFIELFPDAVVSHIGVYRNEDTLQPVNYYFKFPHLKNLRKTSVFILDPMIATGGSMIYALKKVKEKKLNNIIVASLICAPEGINALEKEFNGDKFNIHIYTCGLDKRLNKAGYIMPGLGDAGDRYFGT